MRIGNLEDMEKTKSLPQPEAEEPKEESKWKNWKNWWYYHKWYVVCGVIVLWIAGSLIGSMLGIGKKTADFQIAYVGKSTLSPETAQAVEDLFASLASDYNGDGEILVQLNQYNINNDNGEALYGYASEISLMGDISARQSYFFLTDDPAYFQEQYQIFASPDGGCPEETDYSADDKVILWSDCPLLSQPELEDLSGLFLGRRCFYDSETSQNAQQCSELWELLWNSQGTA